MGKASRGVRYVESPFLRYFTIHQISLEFIPFIVLFFRTLVLSLFVAITEEISWACVDLASVENRGKRVHTLTNINSTA